MWTKIFDYAKWVFTFAQQTDKTQKNVEALQEENKRLTAALERMAYEYQRLRDEVQYFQRDERHEREKAALRLENEMLKFEKRLPAPPSDKPKPSEDQ